MKVVCDGCRAKYQVPDDRVRGRKLKIRCRKCARAIVIRGDLLEEELQRQEALEQPADSAEAAETPWHISIQGEQHGPYPLSQMVEMLAQGQVAWDVYVWTEGMPEWQLAHDNAELVQAVEALGGQADVQGAAPGSYYGGVATVEGLGPQSAQTGAEAWAMSAQGQGHGAGVEAGVEAGWPSSPHLDQGPAMTGERHEDSVLFSTNNLRAAAASSQLSPGNAASTGGHAVGEGSGLIDIRALAQLSTASSLPSESNGHGSEPEDSGREVDEQLINQTSAFATLDSLAPVDRPRPAGNSALPMAILAGSAMIALGGFAAAYVIFERPAASAPVAAVAEPVAQETAEPPTPEPSAAAEQEASAEADGEPEEQAEPAAAQEDREDQQDEAPQAGAERSRAKAGAAKKEERGKREARAKGRASAKRERARSAAADSKGQGKPRRGGKRVSAKAAASSDPLDDVLLKDKADKPADKASAGQEKAEPAIDTAELDSKPKAQASAGSDDRSIDDLLSGAVGDKPAASPAASSLPASPSRSDVLKAMRSVEPAVRACAEGDSVTGTASVALSVSGKSGRVSSVRVTGIQGPVGSCIARAVRAASFEPFSKSEFKINYPYKFR